MRERAEAESAPSPPLPRFHLKPSPSSAPLFSFLCCARNKIYWMTPEWGNRAADLPPETQFFIADLGPAGTGAGPFVALMPLLANGRAFRATLRPAALPRSRRGGAGSATRRANGSKPGPHDLALRVESGDAAVAATSFPSALLVAPAVGLDPLALAEAAVLAAAALSGPARPRTDKGRGDGSGKPPSFIDAFGWCTWDAFYSKVSAQGVADGVASLRAGGAPPRFVIVDDGWQVTSLPDGLSGPEEEEEAKAPTGAAEGEGGGGPAKASVAAASLYRTVLETAPPGSPLLRWFARMASGPDKPLGPRLLAWYAATSDHVRRLAAVCANAKFAHPGAGPGEAMAPGPPGGLKSVVTALRTTQAVDHVLCWHSMYGYWAGVVPGAQEVPGKEGVTAGAAGVPGLEARLIYPTPSPGVLDVDPCYAWSPQVLSGVGIATDPVALYAAMHGYLAAAGVDGVKVDCQGTLGMIGAAREGGLGGGPALAAAYHDALEASIAAKFPPGNAAINCMCHTTEALYSFSATSIVRASDDFWPADPASHTAHVAVCAFNSAFLAPLATPDWDMFHSVHPAARLHAAARVVSGGPVYVSDKPGVHDFDLLSRLVLRDGRVLRPHRPGRPCPASVFTDTLRDGVSLLKVQTVTGGEGGAPSKDSFTAGLVGVFNTQGAAWDRATRRFALHRPPLFARRKARLTSTVSPADVPGLPTPPSGRFVAWEDAAGRGRLVEAGSGVVVSGEEGSGAPVTLSLSRGQADLVTLVPALSISAGLLAAPIGLVDMMNPAGGVLAAAADERKRGLTLRVRGRGRVGVWSQSAPLSAAVRGAAGSKGWTPLEVGWDAGAKLATVTLVDEGAGGGLEAAMPDVEVRWEW